MSVNRIWPSFASGSPASRLAAAPRVKRSPTVDPPRLDADLIRARQSASAASAFAFASASRASNAACDGQVVIRWSSGGHHTVITQQSGGHHLVSTQSYEHHRACRSAIFLFRSSRRILLLISANSFVHRACRSAIFRSRSAFALAFRCASRSAFNFSRTTRASWPRANRCRRRR